MNERQYYEQFIGDSPVSPAAFRAAPVYYVAIILDQQRSKQVFAVYKDAKCIGITKGITDFDRAQASAIIRQDKRINGE